MKINFKIKFNFANNRKIKELKLKRIKFRDNLRQLRRKNNYLLMLSNKRKEDRLISMKYKPFLRFNNGSILNIGVLSGIHYYTLVAPSSNLTGYWLINLNNSISIRSDMFSNDAISTYISKLYSNLCYLINKNTLSFFTSYSYIRYRLPLVSYKSKFLVSKVDRVLVLNNKRSQFYITHLSSNNSSWKTDISVYPGVLAALFSHSNKYTRNKFKKKDKNILRALNRCFYWVLPSYLNESRQTSRMALVVKKYPRSLEFYDSFMNFIVKVYKIKLPLVLINPSIRHSFIKLRKYARVKRRSRKVITKSSSNLRASNLIRSNQVKSISSTYALYKARL